MSYIEQLREVNSRISTTNIKGKEYAEVPSRILAFWELFPDGRIVTECETSDTRCDCRCEVYRHAEDAAPASTGHAYEEKKGAINSTSYVENCETSAIGRALGILGIGSTQALASKEELEHALALQNAKPREEAQVYEHDYSELTKLAERFAAATGQGVQEAKKDILHTFFGNRNPNQFTEPQYRSRLLAVTSKVEALEGANG